MGILSTLFLVAIFLLPVLTLQWYYRRSKYNERNKKGYFNPNQARLEYVKYLATVSDSGEPEDEVKMRHLLFKRAIEAILRIKKLSDEKPPLAALHRTGSISEELMQSFNDAEKETNEEVFEIQSEAEIIQDGWSKTILQEAAVFLRGQMDVAPRTKPVAAAAVSPAPSGTGTGSGAQQPVVAKAAKQTATK